MMMDWFYIWHSVKKWVEGDDGLAAMEAAMLFPPMLALLLGVFDLGNGIVLSQKTISSSQIAADLISRNKTVDATSIDDIIAGAKLSFEPYGVTEFGIDMVSVEFDALKKPQIIWRETENMLPNDDAVASVEGLAESGEGMIIVTVQYQYLPQFAQYIFGTNIDFKEVAFSRGRRSATVTWDS